MLREGWLPQWIGPTTKKIISGWKNKLSTGIGSVNKLKYSLHMVGSPPAEATTFHFKKILMMTRAKAVMETVLHIPLKSNVE